MRAVPGLIGDGLGGQARPQPAAQRYSPDGLAVDHVIVGRAQSRGMPDRHLLLAVAKLGIVVLDLQALRLQCPHKLDGVVVRHVEAGRRVTEAVVDRHQPVRSACGVGLAAAEGELGFERRGHRESVSSKLGSGLLEECARTCLPRLAVQLDQVGIHRAGAGRVGELHERARIGHKAYLTDRSHPLDRLQRVEHGHRHHRDRVPDAGVQSLGEQGKGRRLSADDAAMVGVEEPDEQESIGLGLGPLQHGVGYSGARLASRDDGGFGCVGHGLRVARCATARMALDRIAPLRVCGLVFSIN